MAQNPNPSMAGGGGLVYYDPAGFEEDSRRSREVMVPADHQPSWDDRIMMALGLLQRPGEANGSFWGRGQFKNIMPPSLREPLGRDMELPPDAVRQALSRKLKGR